MDSGLPLTQKGYKMATLEKAPTSNFWSTSLNGAINDSVTTITLNSTVGLQAPGRLVINRQDSTGKNTPSAREVISFTGISGSDLTGVTRGADNSTARSHADGSLVESAIVVGNWDALYKVVNQEHSTSGVHSVADMVTGGSVIDDDTFATASATTLATSESIKAYADNSPSSIARQAIINGGFTVNQRVYVSNATLSAGTYGHDRWKAGASGGDYTFTQLNSSTQITIKSGKSLIQVIEDKNVVGGTYTLSWEGTAQARFGKDSATPSGVYASSPITITGQSAGTVMSVEFNEGTLGKVQLNTGSIALPFMPKSFEEELRACMRYYEKSYEYAIPTATASESGMIESTGAGGACTVGDYVIVKHRYQVPKRLAVTPTVWDQAGNSGKCSLRQAESLLTNNVTANVDQVQTNSFRVYALTTATNQRGLAFHFASDAEL